MNNLQMKMDYLVDSEEARLLRKWKQKALKASAKRTARNYPFHSERAKLLENQRVTLRKEQRNLHLARGFIKNMSYSRIEDETCRTPVNKEALLETLNDYGYFPDQTYLDEWLG